MAGHTRACGGGAAAIPTQQSHFACRFDGAVFAPTTRPTACCPPSFGHNRCVLQAAEFGALLLKRNGDLESTVAALQDQVATLQAHGDVQARELRKYEDTCKGLHAQIDVLVRENVAQAHDPRHLVMWHARVCGPPPCS